MTNLMFTPQDGRKKFEIGQTVWYLDHFNCIVKEGRFVGYIERDIKCEDTVYVRDVKSGLDRIMEAWTFDTPEKAHKCCIKYIERQMDQKQSELKALRKKLADYQVLQ